MASSWGSKLRSCTVLRDHLTCGVRVARQDVRLVSCHVITLLHIVSPSQNPILSAVMPMHCCGSCFVTMPACVYCGADGTERAIYLSPSVSFRGLQPWSSLKRCSRMVRSCSLVEAHQSCNLYTERRVPCRGTHAKTESKLSLKLSRVTSRLF